MNINFRVDQILPSFGSYDAIGTETKIIQQAIREKGIQSDIYTEQGIDSRYCKPMTEFFKRKSSSKDILIHHFSIGSLVPYYLMNFRGRVITRYHNITPPHFFKYDSNRFSRCRCAQGRNQFSTVRQFSPVCWAASSYNLEEMKHLNFESTSVLPVLRDYNQLFQKEPCSKIIGNLKKSTKKTILFVGRVIPNKAHHDLFFLLKQYLTYVDKNIRLICIGAVDSHYGKKLLKNLAHSLDISVLFDSSGLNTADVTFTGPVSDAELVSYYRESDAFVCLSDHEGFCVPLVEAMNFGLPVLAHPSAAVPETLGNAGILSDKTDPVDLIEKLHLILSDQKESERLKRLSLLRAQDFSIDKTLIKLSDLLKEQIDFSLKHDAPCFMPNHDPSIHSFKHPLNMN